MTAHLQPGSPAPDFELPCGDAEALRLSDLRGKNVVLYFYPKDDTSGCTAEAIAFSALKPRFTQANTEIIGLSPDSVVSHAKFRRKHGLEIALAADESKTTLQAYGVWVEKSMYGRKYMGVERATVLIDTEGRIARIWPKVKVPGHADEVLEAARAL